MEVIDYLSPRAKIAHEVSDFIVDSGLNSNQAERHVDKKGRAYYIVSFTSGLTKGYLSIYSHKYFVLKCVTGDKITLMLFKNKDLLCSFMRARFIDINPVQAEMLQRQHAITKNA